MEISIVHRQEGQQQSSKGGIRTIPLIIGNEAFQFIGGLGLVINMIVYLRSDYHMGTAPATMFLFLWNAVGNFLPLLGAFISDSYLGRFQSIVWGSIANLIGSTLLWLTAIIPGAKPAACNPPHQTCQSPILSQVALLHSSFLLMSIGNAGIRPCSLAFGADQFDKRDNPNNAKILQSFFNWYYAAFGISAMIAITVIVYIQQNYGWKVGLGIPVALTALSAILFFVGSPFYVKMEPQKSLLTGLAQVMVAAFKNRHLDFPLNKEEGYYQSIGSNLVAPTNKLRFLNKACIIRSREKDLRHDGSSSNPWSLCTQSTLHHRLSLSRPDSLVRYDAVPVLCTRLTVIENLDVAEQCLQALRNISRDLPVVCLNAGRVAVSTVANIWRELPSDFSALVIVAIPILCNLLQYEDQSLVETVALTFKRIVASSSSSEMLDELCKHGVIHHSNHLLALHSLMTELFQMLARLASVSLVAIRTLFEQNMSSTLKDILTSADL
ncbi:hypothetical protein AAC387_Pa02g2581 [Persea americana]